MTKRKKKPNHLKKIIIPKKQKKQLLPKTIWQLVVKNKQWVLPIISFLATILCLGFVVYPRISVYPGESLNTHDAFQTPFILKNDGYLPIFDIDYTLGADRIEDINNNIIQIGNISGSYKMNRISQLNPNKTSALFISFTMVVPPDFIRSADILLIIKYRPSFFPFSFTERHRFKTERKNTGEYVWFEDYSN